MNKILLLLLLPLTALAIWVFQKKSDVPQVPFTRAARETITSTLHTNGKVEPIEYVEVRVESPGLVSKVLVHQGDTVQKGQVLAELSVTGLNEELKAAEAREAQAHADLQTLRQGGRSSDITDIENNLTRLKAERDEANRNYNSLRRLQEKQAATMVEVEQARTRLQSLDLEIAGLERRRSALVGRGDLGAAQGRLREAEANVELARTRIGQNVIRSPIGGTVYDLPARTGGYLNIGDPVASVGRMDPVRVRVYVDEPEMGRVAVGQPVRITWDALPGKQWDGTVEKRPTEVVALGTRQVGEVLCTIRNPNNELVPGTNVNAFIITRVVQNALTIPKTALRRENGTGVYKLEQNNTIHWQPVKTGADNALKVEITGGLKEGDAVAQPTDQALKDGERVSPVFQQ